jgi:hypothetical protein
MTRAQRIHRTVCRCLDEIGRLNLSAEELRFVWTQITAQLRIWMREAARRER